MVFALEVTVINATDMDYALQQSSYNWKKASISTLFMKTMCRSLLFRVLNLS